MHRTFAIIAAVTALGSSSAATASTTLSAGVAPTGEFATTVGPGVSTLADAPKVDDLAQLGADVFLAGTVGAPDTAGEISLADRNAFAPESLAFKGGPGTTRERTSARGGAYAPGGHVSVPEPVVWMMMIVGLFCMGGALRLRPGRVRRA